MWQPRETMNFSAADHLEAIYRHVDDGFLDYIIVNTRPISEALRRKYALRRAQPVENDLDRLSGLGVKVIARDLLQELEKVRHEPAATAAVALELAGEGRKRRAANALAGARI